MNLPTILDVFDDPLLSGGQFVAETWRPWRSVLATIFSLPCSDSEASLARALSDRQDVLDRKYREAWFVIGRRAGKSKVLAFIAFYLACFCEWKSKLSSGETGVVMVLAADRDQAGVILGYIKGFLRDCPLTAALVTSEGVEKVELATRRVAIEVHTNNYRSPRGRTVIAALCDEVAFWRSDTSASPAEETVRALRPALLSLAPHSMLIGASSPYARQGLLWSRYSRHFGREGSKVLVLQSDSRTMNPGLSSEEIADAYSDDHEAAEAEFGGIFRRDIARFVDQTVLDRAVIAGRRELPRVPGVVYHAFVDPSGGSADSFTCAVAHRSGELAVLDHLSEHKPPFSPQAVVETFAATMEGYGVNRAQADRYAGVWVVELFARHGIVVEQSAKAKSDLYGELLPALNSGRVELLDNLRLHTQLAGLERRTARSGKDSVDHGPGAHDDLANACAGALGMALGRAATKIDFARDLIVNESPALWWPGQPKEEHAHGLP